MTVLIADDIAIFRNMLKDIIVEFCDIQRHNVFEAIDGVHAMSEYKRLKPDIVFLDITMPKLDGISVIKQVMEIDPKARIIMCTSSGEESVIKECVREGALDYLVKPITPSRVVEAIKKVMREKR